MPIDSISMCSNVYDSIAVAVAVNPFHTVDFFAIPVAVEPSIAVKSAIAASVAIVVKPSIAVAVAVDPSIAVEFIDVAVAVEPSIAVEQSTSIGMVHA